MAKSDLELVGLFYERLSGGLTESALELLSDDAVMEIPPSMSAEPDVYRGHEGARRYVQGFDGLVDDVRYEPRELVEEEGNVLVTLRMSGRGAASGIDVALEAVVVHRVEDGKIVWMEPFPDLDSARKALRKGG